MNRREFLASLFAIPAAVAVAPMVIPAGSKIGLTITGDAEALASINSYTLKYLVPKTTDTIFRESPIFVRLGSKTFTSDMKQRVMGPYRKPTDGSSMWYRRWGNKDFILDPNRLPA